MFRACIDARQHVASLTYSNGTADVPMGVMLTHYNLVRTSASHRVAPIDDRESDRMMRSVRLRPGGGERAAAGADDRDAPGSTCRVM